MMWVVEPSPVSGGYRVLLQRGKTWAAFAPNQWGQVKSMSSTGLHVNFISVCACALAVRFEAADLGFRRFGSRASDRRRWLCICIANKLNARRVGLDA
jgi:hypothetical protein